MLLSRTPVVVKGMALPPSSIIILAPREPVSSITAVTSEEFFEPKSIICAKISNSTSY